MIKRVALLFLLLATSLNAAVPTFRGASAAAAHSTTTATPAAPSGLATGDFEILVAGTELAGAPTLSITTAGGSAWTAVTGTPVSGTTAIGEVLYVWWRVRQSGDSDPTVTATADHVIAFRMAVTTGTFDSASPIEIQNTASDNSASNPNFTYTPGTTTLGPDRLVFAFAVSVSDSTATVMTAAANATLANVASTLYPNTTDGGGGAVGAYRGELATAGSVGTWTATFTANNKYNMASFAVKPATGTAAQNSGFFLLIP